MYTGEDMSRDAVALDELTGGVVRQFDLEEQMDEKENMLTIMSYALAEKQPMTCTLMVS